MNPKDRASREEIYLAVASLYRIQGAGLNSRERDLTREILRRLTRDVEMAVRIALAERLADDITAPHDLILLLVDDAIEVARPLILRSPLLPEGDLQNVIAKGVVGHQEAVAGRPISASRSPTRLRSAKSSPSWSLWCATPPRKSPTPPIRRWSSVRAP